jgi:hypothetical protein
LTITASRHTLPDPEVGVTEADVVAIIRKHIEAQFPKTCSMCHRIFRTYADYVRTVTPVGAPVLFAKTRTDGETKAPLYAVGMTNCPCGTTVSISSLGMSEEPVANITRWALERAARDGTTVAQLLDRLLTRLRAEALET